jgi:drug/metabolite transporter (DMT)-like permease
VILMLIAPVLWSTAGVVTRHIERAAPFEQVFWRSLVAAAFIALVLIFSNKKQNIFSRPALFSAAMWAVMFTAFVVALSLTTTANALVVMSISPLLTAFLAFVILKETVPLRTWIAAGAAVVGIAWMSQGGLSGGHLAGMLVALLIPLASAANLVALRAAGARVDLVPAVMLGGALSCLIALPFALPFEASPRDVALLTFLGVFQLGLPCMLLVIASRVMAPAEVALLGLLEVVLGPLWAWLGAGETPGSSVLYGGGIVLAALVLNEISTMRPKPV